MGVRILAAMDPSHKKKAVAAPLLNAPHQVLAQGLHLEQRIFVSTKRLGSYHVQASGFMAQAIVFVIINAVISYHKLKNKDNGSNLE